MTTQVSSRTYLAFSSAQTLSQMILAQGFVLILLLLNTPSFKMH